MSEHGFHVHGPHDHAAVPATAGAMFGYLFAWLHVVPIGAVLSTHQP